MAKISANYELISDKSKNPVTSTEYIRHGGQWLDDVLNEHTLGLVVVDGKLCVKFESEE